MAIEGLTIEKEITMTFRGPAVYALKDLCEIARGRIDDARRTPPDNGIRKPVADVMVCGLTGDDLVGAYRLIQDIFDA